MYTTNFKVQKRKISQLDSVPYTGEYNIDTFKFEFDEEWEGLDKTLVFISGDNRYNIALLNNEALMPFEMYQIKGNIQIGLFGTDNGLRTLATGWIPLYIEEDSYEVNVEPENLPTPTQWDLYVTEINRLLELCQASQEQCELIQAQIEEDYEAYLADLNQIKADTLGYKNETQVLKNQTNQIKNDVIGLKNQIESDIADAELRISEYNANAQAKTTQFNQNATSKTNAFNDNASSKTTLFNSNYTEKSNAINTAGSTQVSAVNTAGATQVGNVETAGSTQVGLVNTAGETAITNIESAEDTAIENIEEAGESYDLRINQLLDQIPVGTVEDTNINVQDSSDLPLKDIQVEGNATQASDPTPTVPVPIKVVTGDNTVNVIGKNILQLSGNNQTYNYQNTHTITDNSYTGIPSANWARTDYKFRVKPNTTYTFSANINFEGITYPSTWYQTIKGVQSQTTYKDGSSTITNKKLSQTFTTTEQDYEIKISFWSSIGGGASAVPTKTTYTNIQLEAGPTATTFEPYQSQSQLLSLGNIELAKIGDYKDKLFKAVNGDKVYDSLDSTTKATLTYGSWYKQGNIRKYTSCVSATRTQTGIRFLLENRSNLHDMTSSTNLGTTYLSNSFVVPQDNSAQAGFASVYNYGWGGLALYTTNSDLITMIGADKTEEQLKDWFDTNVTMYVIINSKYDYVTYTEITDTTLLSQLDALYELQTYKNVTNIFTVTDNEEPILNVTYRKDLQTMFNNLTNAIVSLGNNI